MSAGLAPVMKRIPYVTLFAVCALAAAILPGCSPPSPDSGSSAVVVVASGGLAGQTRDGILAYLAEEARKITDRAKAETASREKWEAVQEQRRDELREMLGLAIARFKTPLNVQIRGRIERDGYVVEKIAFESIPKVYVTANLYLPSERNGPVPGVIYVCGHAFSPHGAKTSYQRHGHTLARHGYASHGNRPAANCRDGRPAPRGVQPRDVRVVHARLQSGRVGSLERHSGPSITWRRDPKWIATGSL